MFNFDALLITSWFLLVLQSHACLQEPSPDRPNIVVIMLGGLGYSDLLSHAYSSRNKTAIDRMVAEGTTFSAAYTPDVHNSPSEAAFMTGRLPIRTGVINDILPQDPGGLPRQEKTIAEMFRENGYTTGMVGAWHLGINQFNHTDGTYLPSKRGFDYVGLNIPFADDKCKQQIPNSTECYLYNGDDVVQQPVDFNGMINKLARNWKFFLEARMETDQFKQPFFFYLSLPTVSKFSDHNSLFSKVSRDLNTDEIASAVDVVLGSLREAEIEQNTLVVLTANHGSIRKNYQLKKRSGAFTRRSSANEDGYRIPLVAWQPGSVPAGRVSNAVVSSMDLYSTFLQISKCNAYELLPMLLRPQQLPLDGVSILHEMKGIFDEELTIYFSEERPILFYCGNTLLAMRFSQYKIRYFATIPTTSDTAEEAPCKRDNLELLEPALIFDLLKDPHEAFPLELSIEYDKLRRWASRLLMAHRQSLEPFEPVAMEHNQRILPRCSPPKCQLNIPEITKNREHQEQPKRNAEEHESPISRILPWMF